MFSKKYLLFIFCLFFVSNVLYCNPSKVIKNNNSQSHVTKEDNDLNNNIMNDNTPEEVELRNYLKVLLLLNKLNNTMKVDDSDINQNDELKGLIASQMQKVFGVIEAKNQDSNAQIDKKGLRDYLLKNMRSFKEILQSTHYSDDILKNINNVILQIETNINNIR